jgi:protein-tyrosine-phosphatase
MSASTPIGFAPSAVPAELVSAGRELAAHYPGVFSPETVVRTVYESYQLMIAAAGQRADAASHAVRFASDWLADAARVSSGGHGARLTAGTPRVLFVCLHDSGRAQMAESLLRRRAGSRVIVRSAGPVAGRGIQPAVVAVMGELGIGVSREHAQVLLDDDVRAADVVVTMGCGDICPIYVGKRYLDWRLPEPVGDGVTALRPLRDRIAACVEELLADLTAVTVVDSGVIPGGRPRACCHLTSTSPLRPSS